MQSAPEQNKIYPLPPWARLPDLLYTLFLIGQQNRAETDGTTAHTRDDLSSIAEYCEITAEGNLKFIGAQVRQTEKTPYAMINLCLANDFNQWLSDIGRMRSHADLIAILFKFKSRTLELAGELPATANAEAQLQHEIYKQQIWNTLKMAFFGELAKHQELQVYPYSMFFVTLQGITQPNGIHEDSLDKSIALVGLDDLTDAPRSRKISLALNDRTDITLQQHRLLQVVSALGIKPEFLTEEDYSIIFGPNTSNGTVERGFTATANDKLDMIKRLPGASRTLRAIRQLAVGIQDEHSPLYGLSGDKRLHLIGCLARNKRADSKTARILYRDLHNIAINTSATLEDLGRVYQKATKLPLPVSSNRVSNPQETAFSEVLCTTSTLGDTHPCVDLAIPSSVAELIEWIPAQTRQFQLNGRRGIFLINHIDRLLHDSINFQDLLNIIENLSQFRHCEGAIEQLITRCSDIEWDNLPLPLAEKVEPFKPSAVRSPRASSPGFIYRSRPSAPSEGLLAMQHVENAAHFSDAAKQALYGAIAHGRLARGSNCPHYERFRPDDTKSAARPG